MSEIPYYVRTSTATTLADTDYLIADNPNSDVAKNGVVIASSEMYSTTSSGGKAESITCQTILELSENDYVEIWVENSTAVIDVTVEYLNVICKSLN